MDDFDRDRHRHRALGRRFERLGAGEGQDRAQPLAAREHQVPHRRVKLRRRMFGVGKPGVERGVHLRCAVFHVGDEIHLGFPSAYASALLGSVSVFFLEGLGHEATPFLEENLDALFGVAELLVELTGELYAFFKGLERRLELQVAILELAHERLETLEAFFEGEFGGVFAFRCGGGTS